MVAEERTPGPWLDWETLEWLYEPQRLLANTADARLMGAAPELLAELRKARNVINALYVGLAIGDEGRAINLATFDAAIAKAAGK